MSIFLQIFVIFHIFFFLNNIDVYWNSFFKSHKSRYNLLNNWFSGRNVTDINTTNRSFNFLFIFLYSSDYYNHTKCTGGIIKVFWNKTQIFLAWCLSEQNRLNEFVSIDRSFWYKAVIGSRSILQLVAEKYFSNIIKENVVKYVKRNQFYWRNIFIRPLEFKIIFFSSFNNTNYKPML